MLNSVRKLFLASPRPDLGDQCKVCGQKASFTRDTLKNNSHHSDPVFDNRQTLTCSKCLSSWCVNCPDYQEISSYYGRVYKVARVSDEALKNWPIWDTRSTQLITLGRMFGTFKKGDVFLDIGPGHGSAMGSAAHLLPEPRFAAIEFNEQAIAFLKKALGNLHVAQSTKGILDHYGKGGVKFVYSAHCFEHFDVIQLKHELSFLRDALSSEGVLAIEVPQANAAFFNKAKNHVPHLTFFSKEGLTALLTACGFDVKVCVGTWGQNPRAKKHVEKTLTKTHANEAYQAKVEALNTGDWLPHDPGLVIKCIATKAR